MKTVFRVIALFVLGGSAMVGTFCTPPDNSDQWFTDLVTGKAVGLLSFLLLVHFFRKWKCKDPYIREYDERQRRSDC